jgi:hypothetical protein
MICSAARGISSEASIEGGRCEESCYRKWEDAAGYGISDIVVWSKIVSSPARIHGSLRGCRRMAGTQLLVERKVYTRHHCPGILSSEARRWPRKGNCDVDQYIGNIWRGHSILMKWHVLTLSLQTVSPYAGRKCDSEGAAADWG